MSHISSYPKIHTIGHRLLAKLFDGPIVVQEKIDGSQFSFGLLDGKLCCRSNGQQINLADPGMFKLGVETAQRLYGAHLLVEGTTYRGEFLAKPKQNALKYDRAPLGNIVLFDAETHGQHYVPPASLRCIADVFGIDSAPVLFDGVAPDAADREPWLNELLNRTSFLGGPKIEGVVIKNYNQFQEDGKILIGKFVSAAFKEIHRHEWKKENPGQNEIIQQIITDYRTSPRWHKAIQHLRERGQLVGGPEDIGPLLKEINSDVLAECKDEIAERLFKHFWKAVARGITKGFAEWYVEQINKPDFFHD